MPCNLAWYALTKTGGPWTCVTPWQVACDGVPEWIIHAAAAKNVDNDGACMDHHR